MSPLTDKLIELLEPTVTTMGFELWGIEPPNETGGILRIYIDAKDGITLDNTVKVSHQINAILDVEDIIQGRYRLEVSSPGMDRPLFNIKQYQCFVGEEINLRLKQSVGQKKTYRGTIKKVTTDTLLLLDEEENHEVALPINLIAKANLISN